MELRLYIQMLQRGWWIVLLTALSALAIALAASYVVTPIYLASARYVVSPDASSFTGGNSVIDSLNTLDKRSIVTTYAEVLNSNTIFQKTIANFQIDANAVADYKRTTVALPEANVLELSVEGPDPKVAALLVNGVGQQAISYIQGLNQGYNINVLDAAQVPTIPVRPQPLRDSSLAVALGLVIGAVLAIVRAQLITPIEAFLARSTTDNDSTAFTRRYFEQKLDETLDRKRGSVSLGLVQLEGLQGFLDVVPQPIAQEVLRQASAIFREQLRGNDLLGRWNNDTFAVLLPDTPGTAAVMTFGRIQIALSKPVKFGEGETLHLRPLIGVAERQGDEEANVLIKWSEQALEQSSRNDSRMALYKTNPFVSA